MTQAYEVVIGLEVHVELLTASKMFCACGTEFGQPPNTLVCPVCLGLPGALPVPNEKAVELAYRAAAALNCRLAPRLAFHRKHYFYPDLTKGYQISQAQSPVGEHGVVLIEDEEGREKPIRIRRLHLEEDTGKSLHDQGGESLVDLNRSGVPLIEIVTEPDIRSPEEARRFLQELRAILLYAGVSNVRMEEGSLRCDANISLRPVGSQAFGTLVEVKNMNSFRSVKRALEYEAQRQKEILERGEEVVRETRHFDETRGITRSARAKEEAADYRYFPEPDLPVLELDPAWLEGIRKNLPELPAQRRQRYQSLGLSPYQASVLVAEPSLAKVFEATLAEGAPAVAAANWVMGELQGYLQELGKEAEAFPLAPRQIAVILKLLEEEAITGPVAKKLFRDTLLTGEDPAEVVEREGLRQMGGRETLLPAVEQAIRENPAAVADYRKGKKAAIGFLVGQVMRLTQGRANPKEVQDLLRQALDGEGSQ
ncbi:MAG: Asp-tRNA(Asn)/Glu-tRNA(Gln) amidotransferase subunit GatB [Clostridiales bacterium]|nr:Asp-tRNA(Asn)/Glu-tRNA(Gln) amidotransferase subunit GatB [Clostridiales bacterium]